MMLYLTSANKIVTSRELEKTIDFPQQSIFTAGRRLKKSGLVGTVSGPFGGYVLAKPPEDITIQEILVTFDDVFHIGKEVAADRFTAPSLGNLAKMFTEVKDAAEKKLGSVTLADLINKGE